MAKRKKSWQEKLIDKKDLPKIVNIDNKKAARWGGKPGDTMVIPSPLEVDEVMRKVPHGKLITINHIRNFLAKKHGTTIACPITTGIFAWIAAHASEENKKEDKQNTTPYWRTLKTNGEINPKYPGGAEKQKALLESEGHRVIKKGRKYLVVDYQKYLVEM